MAVCFGKAADLGDGETEFMKNLYMHFLHCALEEETVEDDLGFRRGRR